jgi:hypothetical protein
MSGSLRLYLKPVISHPMLRIGDQLMAMRNARESAARHWRGSLLV